MSLCIRISICIYVFGCLYISKYIRLYLGIVIFIDVYNGTNIFSCPYETRNIHICKYRCIYSQLRIFIYRLEYSFLADDADSRSIRRSSA